MRYLAIALCVLLSLLGLNARAATCPKADYFLGSPLFVDLLAATGCDTITGYLYASGNVTSLSALSGLTSIGGDLLIISTDLADLDGLEGLVHIGGDVVIRDNAALTNLDGLANITSVDGDLFVEYNEALSSLSGLRNLLAGAYTGNIDIDTNDGLTSLDGFQELTSVGASLSIINNSTLSNIDALAKLAEVDGLLDLNLNPSLQDLDALASLTSVGGRLSIWANGITNVDGLANLTNVGGYLTINENAALTNVDGLANITSIEGRLRISYNATLTSLTIPDFVTTIGYGSFAGNALTSVTIPESVTSIGGLSFALNALTSVTIPESVITIGVAAFAGNALTSVKIPENVETIQAGAFVENGVLNENNERTYTLTSATFTGEYTEWMPDPERSSGYEGLGISPEIFTFTPAGYDTLVSPILSIISACSSDSWNNVSFEIQRDVLPPLQVTQTPEACPFVDPAVLIDELSAFVADLNAKKGILNALDAKLGAVQGALSDLNENNDVAALNAMYAFCYNAQAQSGKQLETADADALIAKADAIIAAIDPIAGLCSE